MAEKPITIGLNEDSDPNTFEPSQENVDRLSEFSVDEPIGDLREQATRIAVSSGVEKNPDNHAKVANLAVETGLPEDTVERQQTAIESRQKALRMLAPDFGQRAPTVRNKFRDPSFVGLSHDDVENLVQTEELMRGKNLGYFEKIGANFRKNQAVIAASDIGVARWHAQLGIGDEVNDREIQRLENLQKEMGFKSDEGFFAGIPIESVGMLPMIFDVMSEGGVAAAGGAAVGGLVGAAVTRTPAGAAAGAKFGGGVGFKIGVFHSVFNIESGLAYNDYIADEGVDRDLAAKAAIAVGIINGSLEFASLKLIGRTATPAVRSIIRRRVRQAMVTESGRKIIQRIAGRYLAAVAGEGLTEGAQEVTTMFGDVFTSQFKDGKEVNPETLDEAFSEALGKLPEIIKSDQVKEAAVVGVQAAAGLSTPGTVASAVVDVRRKQTKTQVEQSRIDKIVELSGNSKVRGRSGRVYRQTIEEVAAEIEEATGEVNEIYWTAKEALAWLEAENIDITEPPPNAAVASVIEQLNDALASDGDIVLSIADFATDIAPSDSFQETVRAHVKLSEDTFTQDEAGNIDETIEKRIKRLVADAQVTLEQQRQTEVITEQVVAQLVDTNKLTPDEAKTSSSLITEYVLTKAARTGLSVEEVFKVMGLTIVGPEVQLEGQTLDQVIESGRFQGKQLEKLRGERETLTAEDEGISTERTQILEFLTMLISPVDKKGDIDELPAIALTDDAAVEQRLQDLLFRGSFQDGTSLRSEPGQQTVLQRGSKKATAASLFEDVQGLKARDDELSARQKEISAENKDLDERVNTAFSGRQVLEQGPIGDLFADFEENENTEFNETLDEATTEVEVKANIGRLAAMLGPQLYGNMSTISVVTVKELFQNSFDAVRSAIRNGTVSDGKIDISTNYFDRTITVRDNGTGMDAETIQNAFLTIAGTEKTGEVNSGGFGIAKMLFLFGNEKLKLVTIKDGVRYTLETTGAELLEQASNPGESKTQLRSEKVALPNGTEITVTVPEEYLNASTGEMNSVPAPNEHSSRDVLENSPLFEDIEVSVDEVPMNIGKNFDASKFTVLNTIKFNWGEARILISKEEDLQLASGYSNVHVLSNGLWQFSKNIKENPFEFSGPSIPRQLYIDIKPSVEPAEDGYPFQLNRQDLTPSARTDYSTIANWISLLFGADKHAEASQGFGTFEVVDADGNVAPGPDVKPDLSTAETTGFNINPNDDIKIVEGVMTVNGETIEPVTQQTIKEQKIDLSDFRIDTDLIDPALPMIHNNLNRNNGGISLTDELREEFGQDADRYLGGIASIFKELRDRLELVGSPNFRGIGRIPVGVSFDNDYLGVNTIVPFPAMYLNPGITAVDARTDVKVDPELAALKPALIANSMITTMIHEMAHFVERSHGVEFITELQSAWATLETFEDMTDIRKRLTQIIKDNQDVYRFTSNLIRQRLVENTGVKLRDTGSYQSRNQNDAPTDAGLGTAVEQPAQLEGEGQASTGDTGLDQDVSGVRQGVDETGAVDADLAKIVAERDPTQAAKAAILTDNKIPEGDTGVITPADGSVNPFAGDDGFMKILLQRKDGEVRGEILLDDDAQGAIIRLGEAADLSTFLHESGHLFLEMEKRFFNDPNISEEAKQDSQAILDWLGVESFNDIEDSHHEKWARGFEAYLYEGKAPSAELRAPFRRFAAWLQNIYRGLRRLDVQLTPEIRQVMDRMLATDEQIAETKAQLALEPLFQTAEEADMTPEEFSEYQGQTQGRAEEVLRKKILAQLTRTAKSWWREELASVQDEVRAELEALPLYRAIAFMRTKSPPEGFDQNKMDRQIVYALAGLATATEKKGDPNAVNPAIDSLSVAIAKLGGLDREEAEAQGVDAAHWRGVLRTKVKEGKQTVRRVPNPENFPAGVGKPLFRKPTDERGKGRTFDEMRELLAEQGMNYLDADTTASDLLAKLLDDLSGDTQYSLNADLDQLFENPNEVPKERFRAPAQLRGLTLNGGMSPDSMAEIFGFASGSELVKQLMETPTLNFAVERQSESIMLQRHGDILNDGTLEAEATEAAHNTEQGAALIKELRVLSGQTDVAAITERQAIRDAAERIIGRKRITSLRPAQYHAAEIKAARESQTAKDAGDLQAAQAAKQRQLFNFHLWRAATAARKSADTMRARLRTMATKKYADKAVRPDYANRMRQFLASYNFLKSSSAGRAQAQASLEAVKTWILLQQEDENSPANVVDAEQITQIRHYSDMTLDELQAVNDIATSLLNAGRRNSKAEKLEFNANMKIMAEHIAEQTIAKKDIGIEDTKSRQRTRWGRAVFAYHRKLESFARELDGFEDLGPFWKLIIKPLLDANNKKLEMQEKAHDALDDIFTGHEGLFNENKNKLSFTLESGKEIQLSLGGRISMLLNWGNEGNREALLNQRDLALSRNDVETIIATLSDSDIDLAQDIWDYIDTFWPEIAAQERTLTGIVPSKVEAAEFEVNGRKIKGGYYPLVEDIARGRFTESDAQREAREAREKIGSTSHATTAHGWTNERKNFAGKAVDLNIDVVFNHTDAVIHDLSHRTAIKDVGRVLNNKDIADAIKTALGREAATAMKTTVDEVAGGNIKTRELSQIQSILRWSRLAVTYGALGFSLKTGFSQMLGFATAVGEFGGRDVVRRGVISYLSNPIENRKFIEENSVFMRERGKTMHRDVTDIMLGLKGSTTMNSVKKFAFLFLLSGDRAISLPVWWGQYQVGMDRVADPAFEGFTTEQDAVDWADRAVSRTQQSGQLMDLANIESKNEFIKMWTVMYSAFSAIYQIAVEQGKKAKIGKISRVQYVYNIMWILIIPSLFEELMTGREDDDDEDASAVNNRWTKAVAGFTLGTMAGLRETGWLMETGRNSELPIQRALKAPFDLATQVEQFEMDAAFIRAAFAIPALFHLPGGSQLTRSAQYLLALEEGDEEGFDVWEFLVTGPRENEDEE